MRRPCSDGSPYVPALRGFGLPAPRVASWPKSGSLTCQLVMTVSALVTQKQRDRYKYELADFLELKSVRAKHNVIADAADEVAAAIGAFLAR